MSQQLSMPTGNGLLSLNLTVPPQAPGTVGQITPGLFTGFSAMMSDVAAEKSGQGLPDGAFLPPQGLGLPQGFSEQAELAGEQVRQRLLYLAEMLGQQGGSGEEGEGLSEEVMAELAKALRSYAEGEMPELPEEVQQKLDELKAAAEELADVEEPVDVADVAQKPVDPLLEQQTSQNEAEDASQPVQVDESLVATGEDEPPVVAENVDQAELVDDVSTETEQAAATADQSVEVAGEVIAEEASLSETESESVTVTEEVEAAAAAAAASEVAEAVEQSVTTAQVESSQRSPVAEAARQEFNADGYRNKGEYISELARSQNRSAGGEAAAIAGEGESEKLAKTARPLAAVDARPQERELTRNPNAVRNMQLDEQQSTPVTQQAPAKKPADAESVPPRPAFTLDKFESMLEASQKLMSRAAAGAERLGDSPFSQRLDSAQSSQVVPQSISQPTQVQKAVTEANNLMMPQNVKMNTAAWSNALAERAIMVAAQSTRVAEIQLDPPELGSLNIRVHVNQDQVSLNFTSPHAHVRDAVEQSLPRLREMFAEQGLALQDSSVSDQQQNSSQREEFAGNQQRRDGDSQSYATENADGEPVREGARQLSLVDYYA